MLLAIAIGILETKMKESSVISKIALISSAVFWDLLFLALLIIGGFYLFMNLLVG